MYCGNNKNHSSLLNGEAKIGDRYSCLRKGIGMGLSLPKDPEYDNNYEPIDTRKIYCGKKKRLPKGYSSMGSNSQCLQKGIGIGKKKRNEQKE